MLSQRYWPRKTNPAALFLYEIGFYTARNNMNPGGRPLDITICDLQFGYFCPSPEKVKVSTTYAE